LRHSAQQTNQKLVKEPQRDEQGCWRPNFPNKYHKHEVSKKKHSQTTKEPHKIGKEFKKGVEKHLDFYFISPSEHRAEKHKKQMPAENQLLKKEKIHQKGTIKEGIQDQNNDHTKDETEKNKDIKKEPFIKTEFETSFEFEHLNLFKRAGYEYQRKLDMSLQQTKKNNFHNNNHPSEGDTKENREDDRRINTEKGKRIEATKKKSHHRKGLATQSRLEKKRADDDQRHQKNLVKTKVFTNRKKETRDNGRKIRDRTKSLIDVYLEKRTQYELDHPSKKKKQICGDVGINNINVIGNASSEKNRSNNRNASRRGSSNSSNSSNRSNRSNRNSSRKHSSKARSRSRSGSYEGSYSHRRRLCANDRSLSPIRSGSRSRELCESESQI